MSGVANSDLIDLLRTTQENLPNQEFEYTLSKQNYVVIDHWFQKDKIQEESGTSIVRNIMLDNSGNARHVRLYQKSSQNVADVQKRISAPWVQIEGQYSTERRELLRNRAPAQLIKLVKSRRLDAQLAMADLLDTRGFLTPNTSSDDLNPRGLPYYLSKLVPAAGSGYDAAIDIAGGFSGRRILWGDASQTLNDKGGLNPTVESKWRNYADTKTAIDATFVTKMRKAFHLAKFKSPMTVTEMAKGSGQKFRIYMGVDELTAYEGLVTAQNTQNLGADLDKFHGVTTFKRVPIVYAPALDDDASNPVYGVNHDKFFPIVLSGDWLREGEPISDVDNHNVFTTYVDGSYQYFCTNVREAGFVIHDALTE